jgi:phage shock protein E
MTPVSPIAAVAWLALAAAGGCAAERATERAVPLLGAAQLAVRQQARDPALVVLDVRTPAEYAAGHVPGAVNVPHDQVEARLAELDPLRDRDLVVYCKSGVRARLALEALGKAGFRNLWHLDGDMQGWAAGGRPVETPAPAAPGH